MNANVKDFPAASTAGITAWLTSKGVDFLVRSDEGRQRRDRVEYKHGLKGTVAGNTVVVTLDSKNDEIVVTSTSGSVFHLTKQPKGHYFSFLHPLDRAEPVDMETACKLAGSSYDAPEEAPF